MTFKYLAAIAAFSFASPALAQNLTITDLNSPVPAGTSWGTLPGENTGTIAITNTSPRSGNGSLELTGDRTRAQTGVQYGGGTPTGATLDQVNALTFDYNVANGGIGGIQSPALRLLVQDNSAPGSATPQRSELIWEAAYNDANGAGAGFYDLNTWYTTDANARFYRNVGGNNPTFVPGTSTYVFNTIAGWAASSFYSNDAFVSGISVGSGSGAGANFHGFADNVTATGTFSGGTNDSRSFNFETAAVTAAVPEPSSWAMMLVGFGAVGGAMRRRRRSHTLLQVA